MNFHPITRPCEGGGSTGHTYHPGFLETVVICQMCGGHFEAVTPGHVPLHLRADVIAMLERGDFDGR